MVALDLVTVAALALLVVGIVGSAVPSIPGPLLSLAGVVVYWLGGGTAVSTGTLTALAVVAVVAVVADWFAGSLAAKYGGASWTASILAGIVGLVLLVALGPIGSLLGIVGTIFVIEALRKDAGHASKAAVYSTIGVLGSLVVQVLLTAGIFLTFAITLVL